MTQATEDHPLATLLGRVAFALILAIVVARCLMLESIRDIGGFSASAAVRSPGPATSIVIDWLSFVPVLLVLVRSLLDRTRRSSFGLSHALLSLLAMWSLASVAWADDKFLALISAARIAGGAALFWATSQLVTRSDHLRVIVGLVVGILLVNVLQGLYYQNVDLPDLKHYWEQNREQIFAERGWKADDYAAQRFELKVLAGEMLNFSMSANVLGALVVSAALVAFAAGMQRVRDKDDLGWAGAMFIAGLGSAYVLAYTGSKASWTALVIGIALLAGWHVTRDWLARHRSLAFILSLATIAAGIALVVGYGLSGGGLPSDSLNFRWRYWIGAWRLFLEHPFIGVGWGNFGDFYLAHRLPQATEEIQDPHNFAVRWATELGLVGLALGVAWLIAWAWRAAGCNKSRGVLAPESGPGTARLSMRPVLPSDSRMPIARVLLALILAFALTLACTLDFYDASYAILETFRQAFHVGIIALAIGVVCIGPRASTSAAMTVDARPAPWLVAGLFIGVVMMLVQSTIDIALSQPGPWVLVMVMMGSVLGSVPRMSTLVRTSAAEGTDESTHPWHRTAAVLAVVSIAQVVALILVVRISIAEWYAASGDALVSRGKLFDGYEAYESASKLSPVTNFDYRAKEALAFDAFIASRGNNEALSRGRPLTLHQNTIDAAPHHPLSWLTRARYFASQTNLHPDYAQQAIDDFARAIALNPNDTDLRLEYADLLERFGRQFSAAEQLEAALAIDDKLDPKEPERLELRSPGKYETLRKRAAALRAATTVPSRER